MYQIWKNKLIRRKTEYIIVVQAKNMRDMSYPYFDPMLMASTYEYTWGKWQDYFYKDLKKRMLPCHYFVEMLDKDYVVFQGLGEEHPSYFLTDLVNAGVVNYEYQHAIVVAIGENYNRDIPEQRMFQHLASKCICSLMRRYNIKREKVKYFDEVLNPNWKDSLKIAGLKYDIETTKYFDPFHMEQAINYFKH